MNNPSETPPYGAPKGNAGVPDTRKSRRAMTLDVDVRRSGSRFTRMKLAHLVRRSLSYPDLSLVESRREALALLPDYPAHAVYEDPERRIHPDQISLPTNYGHVLYSLAEHLRPRLIVESGAGFGISGMYLSCALAPRSGKLTSFEIGDYWDQAQASFRLIHDGSVVHRRPFEEFADCLPSASQVDLAFVDAVHNQDVVVRSVRSLLGWMKPGGLIVLDDIGQNESMRAAWPLLARHPFISLAARVNRRLGILEVREP